MSAMRRWLLSFVSLRRILFVNPPAPFLTGLLVMLLLGAWCSADITEAGQAMPVFSTPVSGSEDSCVPGSGWRWSYGPVQPEAAERARRLLNGLWIDATVVARTFGETDSCGTFSPHVLDFRISLRDDGVTALNPDRQGLASTIRKALQQIDGLPLGNVTVTFPDGQTIMPKPDDVWEPFVADRSGAIAAPAAVTKKVYVIVYDPTLRNGKSLSEELDWNSHAELTGDTVAFFQETSHGEVNYTVVETTVVTDGWPELNDGFRYTEAEYLAVYRGQQSPHTPDGVNYNKIVNSSQFDICGKANRGEIDEVWIYNGPWFGFYESTLVGPGAYSYNSGPVPGPYTCNRLIPIMGPSPERDLNCAIENFGHRTEATMTKVYGGWDMNRTGEDRTSWDRWALVDYQSTMYDYSGCGSVHYPPNGQADYDYANPGAAQTNCGDFVNYPDLHDPYSVLETVTCSTWSCDHLAYFDYWFSNLPANAGCGDDRMMADWWPYFANPDTALDPTASCPYPPEVTLAGRVTAGDGTPVQDATIGVNGPLVVSTTTGHDGRYAFSNLSDGIYTVTADKSGFTAPSPSIVTVPPNTYDVDFVLRHSQLTVQEVNFSPTTVYAGGLLQVEVVVQNTGDEMAQTQGPSPTFIYPEGDTFESLGYPAVSGKWRVGVNFGSSYPYGDYIYRWGTGTSVQPGETATITGYVRLLTPQVQDYWVGIVREGFGWWDEGRGRTSITVASCSLATVPAPNLSAQPIEQTVLRLNWTSVSGADEYWLYRDSSPHFVPFGAPYRLTQDLYFEDTGALGDTEVGHFYAVKASLQNGCATVESRRVGEFEFQLVPGVPSP